MIAPQLLGGVESTRRWIGKDINAALQWDKKKIHASSYIYPCAENLREAQ